MEKIYFLNWKNLLGILWSEQRVFFRVDNQVLVQSYEPSRMLLGSRIYWLVSPTKKIVRVFYRREKKRDGAVCIPLDVRRVGSPVAELEGWGRRRRLADVFEV